VFDSVLGFALLCDCIKREAWQYAFLSRSKRLHQRSIARSDGQVASNCATHRDKLGGSDGRAGPGKNALFTKRPTPSLSVGLAPVGSQRVCSSALFPQTGLLNEMIRASATRSWALSPSFAIGLACYQNQTPKKTLRSRALGPTNAKGLVG
jgi:hypothetical protein